MNQEPDNYEYRDTIGFVPWWVAFPAAFVLLCLGLGLANFTIEKLIQTDSSPVPTQAVTTERTGP